MLFSFPAGTKMFQFPAFASVIRRMTGLQPAGLSHSEISGSRVICTYPKLIAAYHVLHRLQEPRHPPYALSYLLAAPQWLWAVSAESCTYCLPFLLSICSFVWSLIAQRQTDSLSNMSKIILCSICCGVENNGFEPLTPCLQSRCSSQLS